MLAKQPDLNATMRAILVDWLAEVAMKHELKLETLFLTVNIIDRFLDQVQTTRQRLQLVGVAAMKIASKFEEDAGISMMTLVAITSGAFSKDEIHHMEVEVLRHLNFVICVPTAAHFMRRFQRLNQCPEDSAHGHLLQYLLELSLMDCHMSRYQPSRLVAAAVLLSNRLMKHHPSWPPKVASHCKFDLLAVKVCARHTENSHCCSWNVCGVVFSGTDVGKTALVVIRRPSSSSPPPSSSSSSSPSDSRDNVCRR